MKRKQSGVKRGKTRPRSAVVGDNGLNRRTFVKLIPALGAATVVVPHLQIVSALAQTPSPTPMASPSPSPTPLRVTKEMLRGAEQLFGIELTDAQKQMALQNVNSNLDRYETLRKINVPLDTEPATLFHPALPGKRFNVKAVTFKLGRIDRLNFNTVEDLAFATVPQLADLIRNRRISSIDLTRMYLARLKRYGPKLNCTVTLTEELALAQAAEQTADQTGKHRGPLHGIPGVLGSFATKAFSCTTWGQNPIGTR